MNEENLFKKTYTLDAYEVIQDENENNISVKRDNGNGSFSFIPYGAWKNKDWVQYAELAGIEQPEE